VGSLQERLKDLNALCQLEQECLHRVHAGRNVVPGPSEAALKDACPQISQVCILGDGRPFRHSAGPTVT
jgi:hypothetical protein